MIVDPGIEQYAVEHSEAEPPHLAALAGETRAGTQAPNMMVGPLEGQFLGLMVALTRPRRILEIGTFTGYSALSMAAAMPPEATITPCELNPDHAAIARRAFAASPYADRIDLRLGPALDTLAGLDGPFDLVFVDADKENYPNYFDAVLPKLAPDGVILADNVLWSGRVVDETDESDSTRAIRAFNDKVRDDPRVQCVMTTIRDGVTLIRKRRP